MRAQFYFCIVIVSLICRGSSTVTNMNIIAIRSTNLNLTDSYRSVLVPLNWTLQLVCTCVIDAVINCPSANFKWAPAANLRDVSTSPSSPGDPTKLTLSNINWPIATSETKCVRDTEGVKLDIAIFNVTAQHAAINELNKPSSLQCTLRSNDRDVLSAIRLSWYRELPQSGTVDGADTADDVNLNALVDFDSKKWIVIQFNEQLSQKDTTLRYTRTDTNLSVSYQPPNSSLIGAGATIHHLLVSTLHITRASREDVGTYRCVYVYDYKYNNTPRPIDTWTRNAYANLRLFSKPFKAGTGVQSDTAKQDESLIVSESTSFTVDCNVFGSPMPRVTSWWLRETSSGGDLELFSITSNSTSNGTLPLNVGVEDLRGIQNGRLRVLSATYAHRGRYECVAENSHGQTKFAWLIRVKSRYAFIYPLVGIVIELVVLGFLIVAYERRKAKSSAKMDDGTGSSAEEEPAATSTNGGSHQSELRYRVA